MEKNRKNLFIELNLRNTQNINKGLINNWTKPTPKEYHLVNSPALTFQIASLSHQ
jgi:hypothetical protein